ncbi:hypothetical protein PUN28_002802 [Cardiocondyla obscurior]|uniref:Uncharacterized protein n=1 Tax=Cardiocondyla obscurior TaxID=286306 RepID=A0AAW2GW42_9HYME
MSPSAVRFFLIGSVKCAPQLRDRRRQRIFVWAWTDGLSDSVIILQNLLLRIRLINFNEFGRGINRMHRRDLRLSWRARSLRNLYSQLIIRRISRKIGHDFSASDVIRVGCSRFSRDLLERTFSRSRRLVHAEEFVKRRRVSFFSFFLFFFLRRTLNGDKLYARCVTFMLSCLTLIYRTSANVSRFVVIYCKTFLCGQLRTNVNSIAPYCNVTKPATEIVRGATKFLSSAPLSTRGR